MSRMLITGGCVITMDAQLGELPQGDVLIENGRIAAIAPRLDRAEGAETIDAAGMIVMPGLINGHLHTWQSALRGIAAGEFQPVPSEQCRWCDFLSFCDAGKTYVDAATRSPSL